MNYDPKSSKAEEFINDEEIRETLLYADRNKNNVELIDKILDKARPKKTSSGYVCSGLTHREASVLLSCEIPEKVEEIYKIAEQIKLAFYGNRIVMFAPLYLSNYCVNGCLYCPYHHSNKHIARKKLTMEEIEENFKDVDFFSGIMDGLQEALAYKKGKAAADTFVRKSSLPSVSAAEIRASLHMTQKAFADVLGVSCRTVEAWESGKSTPTPTAKKLMYLIGQDHSLVQKL